MDARAHPLVTVKWAQSLDGRIATSTGHSHWISGQAARTLAHQLRAENDAVMVGIGTVLTDDPQLTVRLTGGRNPTRVIVDSRLRTPPNAALLTAGAGQVLIATTEIAPREAKRALTERGARVLRLADRDGRVDLEALLAALHAEGVRRLLVEGGAGLITSLVRQRLANRLVAIVAPILVGSGLEAVGDLGVKRIEQAICLESVETERLGSDFVIRAELVGPAGFEPATRGL